MKSFFSRSLYWVFPYKVFGHYFLIDTCQVLKYFNVLKYIDWLIKRIKVHITSKENVIKVRTRLECPKMSLNLKTKIQGLEIP